MAKGIWVKVLKYKNSPMKAHLLREWQHQDAQTPSDDADAGAMLFIELVHPDFKIELNLSGDLEKIEVIRWQFPLTDGMLRTAFAAQGLTLEGGVVADLRRTGGLDDDELVDSHLCNAVQG